VSRESGILDLESGIVSQESKPQWLLSPVVRLLHSPAHDRSSLITHHSSLIALHLCLEVVKYRFVLKALIVSANRHEKDLNLSH